MQNFPHFSSIKCTGDHMKSKLAKLISVKCIVTLVMTGVFSYLAIVGKVSSSEFITIFTCVISFYFGTQHERINQDGE